MNTSAINNHIREIRAAVSDYCPRSHWAFAWRNARLGDVRIGWGADELLIDEAYAAYDARCREERRVAAVAECCFNLKEWLLAKRAARKWVPVAACFTKREFNEACETPF